MKAAVFAALAAASTNAALASGDYTALYPLIMQRANATLASLNGVTTMYPTNGYQSATPGSAWQYSSYSGWTSGFFPGLLLRLANYSRDRSELGYNWWLQNGQAWTAGLAPEQFDDTTHDIGFILYTSYGELLSLTGDSTAQKILLQAAETLTKRYSPVVGCIRSWGSIDTHPKFEVIADNMINLELLWWAGQVSGNSSYWTIARSHADHMMRDLFQPWTVAQGGVWHLIVYNDTNGNIISRSSTPQGLGNNTVWSRGESWSLYGFTMAYRYTRDAKYLAQAQAAAEFWIAAVTECCGNDAYNWAPLWDFNTTQATGISVDTSAMMVAASGLIELSWYADAADAARYLGFAKTALDSAMANYLFDPVDATNVAALRNGTVTYPLAGIPIIYGDYYLLEAAMRYDATPKALRDAAVMPLTSIF